ncbi:ABC transporter ATP-binding protein [Alloscardovia venturai]|uniref:ABC transporter ATP-binding protein n=1 Tax=Alloscardovia venturai TaxID=1769421 RepID=A0ABW2Y3K3_9BIFI
MDSAISTRELTKIYKGVPAVSQVNLNIPQGSVYGFLGPNGAGKTTTMKMILGLIHPTSGSVSVLGTPMNQKNRLEILRSVGSLIEQPSYYGNLTAYENLDIVRHLKNLPESVIAEALHTVQLDPQSKKLVKHFSLGMKQRLGTAAALLGRPRVLLLDEPTNGLDPAGIQEIRELIRTLPHAFGMTVLVSSHLLSEIDQMAQYVGIISHGSMKFDGSLESLHRKAHSWVSIRTTDSESAVNILKTEMSDRDNFYNVQADSHEEGYFTLNVLDDDVIAHVTRLLITQGIDVLRVEEHHEDLESIFLSMTEDVKETDGGVEPLSKNMREDVVR